MSETAPEDPSGACERLRSWPRCRDWCKKRRAYGFGRKPHVFYSARMAQAAADAELRESKRGMDETEASVAARLSTMRSCLARGLSPQQVATLRPELGLSASTICRWVDASYAEMTDLDGTVKILAHFPTAPRPAVRCGYSSSSVTSR